MAAGDFTLVHHGVHDLSGATIITAVAGVNIPGLSIVSGAGLYIVPASNGQAAILEVNVA